MIRSGCLVWLAVSIEILMISRADCMVSKTTTRRWSVSASRAGYWREEVLISERLPLVFNGLVRLVLIMVVGVIWF